MNCPKCNFEEWKLASLVYSEGLSFNSSETETQGILKARANTTGHNQTLISSMAAPPEDKRVTYSFLFLIFSIPSIYFFVALNFSIIYGFFWAIFIPAIGYFLIKRIPNKEYDENLNNWKKTRICSRCGTFYIPN